MRKKINIDGWLVGSAEHGESSHLLLKVVVVGRVGHASRVGVVVGIRIHHAKWAEVIWLLSHHVWILLSHGVVLVGIGRVGGRRLLLRVDFDLLLADGANNLY